MASEGCLEGDKNDDLELSLSLGYGGSDGSSLKELNPIHPTLTSGHGRSSIDEIFHLCDPESHMGLVYGGLDVRRMSTEDEEEKNEVSSPNSTISSTISLKRIKREKLVQVDATLWKKLRLSNYQCKVLEDAFKEHDTLNLKQKIELAKQLSLRPTQVEVWFQNRRARIKLNKTEAESAKLKRRCENLTADIARLQKQLMELRLLEFSPQLHKHINLTACCQHEHLSLFILLIVREEPLKLNILIEQISQS